MMDRRSFLQALSLGIVSTTIISKVIPQHQPMTPNSRMLTARCSEELEQDLRAYDADLQRLLREECDRELLKELQEEARLFQEEFDLEVLRTLQAAVV